MIPAALEMFVYVVGAAVIVATLALSFLLALLLALASLRPRPRRGGRI